MLSLFACSPTTKLPTVSELDITKYAGTWYEIARFNHRFEKDLECVTATYTLLENGKIEVLNKGHLIADNTKIKEIVGKAWVADVEFPGQLKVQFFWPFAAPYYVFYLDSNYQTALVGTPSRGYFWMLSKTPTIEETTYNQLVEIAKQNGFDTSKLSKVKQNCK